MKAGFDGRVNIIGPAFFQKCFDKAMLDQRLPARQGYAASGSLPERTIRGHLCIQIFYRHRSTHDSKRFTRADLDAFSAKIAGCPVQSMAVVRQTDGILWAVFHAPSAQDTFIF